MQPSFTAADSTTSGGLRMIQHKQEAFWFYRYLSIVYDHIGALSAHDMTRDTLLVH